MWTHLVHGFVLVVAAAALDQCFHKSCKNTAHEKHMCGSDGLTYPNRCQFERARCRNKNLTLVKRGTCATQRTCMQAVQYSNTHPESGYKPHCQADGSYTPAQCHLDTGFCWCVTPQGVPLPYTSIKRREGKPRCGKNNKVTRKRSRRQHKRRCKQGDKAIFNNNLIKTFYTEWSRDTNIEPVTINNETDRTVVHWKFDHMDLNTDGMLDKREYKELQRMVKNMVTPKRCAKSFVRNCDMNGDAIISKTEWAECLTRDGIDDGLLSEEDDDDDDGGDYILPQRPAAPPHGVLSSERGINDQTFGEESSEIKDDEPMDCLSDRQTALSEQQNNKGLYVPECTPDGRYQKIQCYKSAGYCWCVHEDTGKNIPGTSVKNGTPQCDQLAPAARPMKGCPDDKKKVFLKDLMQFLQTRMAQITNGSSASSSGMMTWKASKEEQAATWSFVIFDKNKNKMLDRNEWKAFKETAMSVKSLKRCGKKLPRYCDINKDRQISMTEWLDCLNVHQVATTKVTQESTRSGKNPLHLLIED